MKLRTVLKRIALILSAIAFVSLALSAPLAAADSKGYTVTAELSDTVDDKEEIPENEEPLPVPLFHLFPLPLQKSVGSAPKAPLSQNHPLPLFKPPRS